MHFMQTNGYLLRLRNFHGSLQSLTPAEGSAYAGVLRRVTRRA